MFFSDDGSEDKFEESIGQQKEDFHAIKVAPSSPCFVSDGHVPNMVSSMGESGILMIIVVFGLVVITSLNFHFFNNTTEDEFVDVYLEILRFLK